MNKTTEHILRRLIRESLFSNSATPKWSDPTFGNQNNNYTGTSPEVNTYFGESYEKIAQAYNISYYVYDSGKIDKGDTSVPANANAVKILNEFARVLASRILVYTVSDSSGNLPDIDTSFVGGGISDYLPTTDKEKFQIFSRNLANTILPKVKTIYSAAMKYAQNDRQIAAAICYEGMKALPGTVGVCVFTHTGAKSDETAYRQMSRIKISSSNSYGYVNLASAPTPSLTIAHTSNDYAQDDSVVAKPVIFLDGDKPPDTPTIEHEVDHAVEMCFNAAFKKILSMTDKGDEDKTTGAGDSKEGSETSGYIYNANLDIISALAPPAVPRSNFKVVSTPATKAMLSQARDFIKNHAPLITAKGTDPMSAAQAGFQILSALINRDYSGLGGELFDENGTLAYDILSDKPLKRGQGSLYKIQSGWSNKASELRNMVLAISREHKRLKKQLGTAYTSAADVRPMLAKLFNADTVSEEGRSTLILLAALGPHTAAEFDSLGAVAMGPQTSGGTGSQVTESTRRRVRLSNIVRRR